MLAPTTGYAVELPLWGGVGGTNWPAMRGLVAAVKYCCVRKARFFLCRQRTEMTHHYRRHCSGFQYREGEHCFVLCFPIPQSTALLCMYHDLVVSFDCGRSGNKRSVLSCLHVDGWRYALFHSKKTRSLGYFPRILLLPGIGNCLHIAADSGESRKKSSAICNLRRRLTLRLKKTSYYVQARPAPCKNVSLSPKQQRVMVSSQNRTATTSTGTAWPWSTFSLWCLLLACMQKQSI